MRQLERLIEEAAPVLEAAGDHYALYLLYYARSEVASNLNRCDAQILALEQALHTRPAWAA